MFAAQGDNQKWDYNDNMCQQFLGSPLLARVYNGFPEKSKVTMIMPSILYLSYLPHHLVQQVLMVFTTSCQTSSGLEIRSELLFALVFYCLASSFGRFHFLPLTLTVIIYIPYMLREITSFIYPSSSTSNSHIEISMIRIPSCRYSGWPVFAIRSFGYASFICRSGVTSRSRVEGSVVLSEPWMLQFYS